MLTHLLLILHHLTSILLLLLLIVNIINSISRCLLILSTIVLLWLLIQRVISSWNWARSRCLHPLEEGPWEQLPSALFAWFGGEFKPLSLVGAQRPAEWEEPPSASLREDEIAAVSRDALKSRARQEDGRGIPCNPLPF